MRTPIQGKENEWCGQPDLNRHEISLNRFSYYSMSPWPRKALQSGLCLLHILRLRRLVYSLYTFMNIFWGHRGGVEPLFFYYLLSKLLGSPKYLSEGNIPFSPTETGHIYIQFSSALSAREFRRISQHSLRSFLSQCSFGLTTSPIFCIRMTIWT